ncbi:hypothetical protein J5N97_017830 [Dioscorea zingiberensis]|uniref:Uncharacterized protein n=1 Tax=Dioscorea zingiberensis TaxID=325984 RepID=A0A9D5CPV5_9LILI|nr:hypothetical protein J5N97_017830 [Dioscorea zingiberensis]
MLLIPRHAKKEPMNVCLRTPNTRYTCSTSYNLLAIQPPAEDPSLLLLSFFGCEEFQIMEDRKVKAFRTHHVNSSQDYIIYFVKQRLKLKYAGNLHRDIT